MRMFKIRSLAASLGLPILCLVGSTLEAQTRECGDVTPEEANWWHWQPNQHPDSASWMHAPEAPPIATEDAEALLPGRYSISMYQTLGGDEQVHGYLTLRQSSHDESRVILWGYIDTKDNFPGYRLPVDVGSRDSLQPGVEVSHYEDGALIAWAGNPGLAYFDSGVGFHIFEVSRDGFRGRWVDGAAITVRIDGQSLGPPQGYFCAWRDE